MTNESEENEMRWFGLVSSVCLIATFLACGGYGLAYEKRLVGSIGLRAVDTLTQMVVIAFHERGGAEVLVPETVVAVGWDASHVIARRHPPDDSGRVDKARSQYFIVGVRDHKVYGPFGEPEYRSSRERLGVAEGLDFTLNFDKRE